MARLPQSTVGSGSQHGSAGGASSPRFAYPPSRRQAVVDLLHGTKVPDPYRWLEDDASQEVQSWLAAQDSFARRHIESLSQRPYYVAQLQALADVDSVGVPTRIGGSYWYTKRSKGEQRYALFTRPVEAQEETPLLSVAAFPADAALAGFWPSPNGETLLYALSHSGSDVVTLHLFDVKSRRSIDSFSARSYATIPPTWNPSSSGFYYAHVPPDPTLDQASQYAGTDFRYHRLQGLIPDNLVRGPTGDANIAEVLQLSPNGRWLILVRQYGYDRRDVLIRKASAPQDPWHPLLVGKSAMFFPHMSGDTLYLVTNYEAPRYKVIKGRIGLEPGEWKDVISERADSTLDSLYIVGDRLVTTWIQDAASRLETCSLDGSNVVVVQTPSKGVIGSVSGDPKARTIFVDYQSFTTPRDVYRVSFGESTLHSMGNQAQVDLAEVTTEQFFTTSQDGTRIPFFLTHRRDVVAGSQAPAILYAYGGFGENVTPQFNPSIVPWVRAGGVYAAANIRGGGEYGAEWHSAGTLANKQKSIDDLIAVATSLRDQRWTTPPRLALRGASNGGLVVGAALIQRPDLFGSAVCSVPLFDMIRYAAFGGGRAWISEYGDPENREQFFGLLAYSPYHHVKEGVAYPALLVQSATDDDRVHGMHARKFVAALQGSSSGGPVLLTVEHKAGHTGSGELGTWIAAEADAMSFISEHTGLRKLGEDYRH